MITPADMSSGHHNTEQMLVMSKQWKTFKASRQKHFKTLRQKLFNALKQKHFVTLNKKQTCANVKIFPKKF